jgi:hypothetical protein
MPIQCDSPHLDSLYTHNHVLRLYEKMEGTNDFGGVARVRMVDCCVTRISNSSNKLMRRGVTVHFFVDFLSTLCRSLKNNRNADFDKQKFASPKTAAL